MLMSYRELLLLKMLNLMLLCTIDNIGCMACTLVIIGVELLRVRVVYGWMRARTPAGPSPRGGPLLQGVALFERLRRTSDLF